MIQQAIDHNLVTQQSLLFHLKYPPFVMRIEFLSWMTEKLSRKAHMTSYYRQALYKEMAKIQGKRVTLSE